MNKVQTESLNRGEFLRTLGLSGAALMSVYCLGGLTGCAKDDDSSTVTPATGNGFSGNADPAKGPVDFTLDLTSDTYKKLTTAGEFVSVGSVVVANASSGMVAVGRICTHQGGLLSYRKLQDDFECNIHGGLFRTTGAVKGGEPKVPVPSYKTTLNSNGNSLRVTA